MVLMQQTIITILYLLIHPGHASIYTGTTPADHGIIGNNLILIVLWRSYFIMQTMKLQNPVGTLSDEGKC
jgi:predicted AlkP superfamily pyrophosphatase or phosphodiesterase